MWFYLEKTIKRSGIVSERWFPYTRYSDMMLQSPRLRQLRYTWLDAHPTLAPVVAAVLATSPPPPPRL